MEKCEDCIVGLEENFDSGGVLLNELSFSFWELDERFKFCPKCGTKLDEIFKKKEQIDKGE